MECSLTLSQEWTRPEREKNDLMEAGILQEGSRKNVDCRKFFFAGKVSSFITEQSANRTPRDIEQFYCRRNHGNCLGV